MDFKIFYGRASITTRDFRMYDDKAASLPELSIEAFEVPLDILNGYAISVLETNDWRAPKLEHYALESTSMCQNGLKKSRQGAGSERGGGKVK